MLLSCLQHGTTVSSHPMLGPHPCPSTHPAPIGAPATLLPTRPAWIQTRLCGKSVAPYSGTQHKWAGNQVKHSPCLFSSLAGNTHPRSGSQRPQFSGTLQGPKTRFHKPLLGLTILCAHPQVGLFEYAIVAFNKVKLWQYSDDCIGQWLHV